MTDPTPQTTATRDEAVLKAADEMRECMQSARFGHTSVPTSMLAAWRQLLSRLASAPAPASGGVDAVKVRAAIRETEYKYFGDYEFSEAQRDAVETLVEVANLYLASGPAAETKGPYEARICKGMPADCCDYGVVSLSEGREVCRVWREQDARAIAASLSPAATPVEAGGEAPPCWWIDHGSHGQITQRPEEAHFAVSEGKRVVAYSATALAKPPSEIERLRAEVERLERKKSRQRP